VSGCILQSTAVPQGMAVPQRQPSLNNWPKQVYSPAGMVLGGHPALSGRENRAVSAAPRGRGPLIMLHAHWHSACCIHFVLWCCTCAAVVSGGEDDGVVLAGTPRIEMSAN
jgi:hypothetical protein